MVTNNQNNKTMDNGKEFTRQILAEMVKMAKQIFAKITVQEDGTFTAYELWKCKDAILKIWHRIEADDKLIYDLLGKWDFNNNSTINGIYRPLYEALQSAAAESAPADLKCESEPENGVICDIVIGRKSYGALCLEQKRLKSIGNSLYKDNGNLYFWYGVYCYCLGAYTHGVAMFLKKQGNNIRTKIWEMMEQGGICTESAKLLREKMYKDGYGGSTAAPETIPPNEDEGTYEDLPPVPYNRQGHQKTWTAHNAPTNATGSEISPFEPRLRVGGIIYRPTSKVAAERTGSPNLGICRVLVRGATKEIATDIKFDYMIIDKFKNNITRWKY